MDGSVWSVAGTGDFDGDSRADVLWRNSANGYNTIWRSASSTTGLAVTALAAPWQVAGTGDFNADGKADILWRNPTSGANVIWLGADSTKTQADRKSTRLNSSH